MKLALACLLLAATSSLARADDIGMRIIQVMMRFPAVSADGKHIAVYSIAAGDEKVAKTSVVVFGAKGKLEQRIPIVPPNTDRAQAEADIAKVTKLLDDGGYKHLSRMAQEGGKLDKQGTYTVTLKSEDVAIDIKIAKRKVSLTGTRGKTKLKPITFTLPAKDGPCAKSDSFGVANTLAGYDKPSKQLAFAVDVTAGMDVCFAHEYVVTLD